MSRVAVGGIVRHWPVATTDGGVRVVLKPAAGSYANRCNVKQYRG